MKNKTVIRIFFATLLALAALDSVAQTKVRNIEIVNPERTPFDIYIVVDSVTWIQHDLTFLEYDYGWKYNNQINFDAKKGEQLRTAFVTCSDTTFLSIVGGENREVYKGGTFVLDGSKTIIGK